ncbi:MAG: hypothetical protein ABH833_03755 [Parcubacteria group bacterium]
MPREEVDMIRNRTLKRATLSVFVVIVCMGASCPVPDEPVDAKCCFIDGDIFPANSEAECKFVGGEVGDCASNLVLPYVWHFLRQSAPATINFEQGDALPDGTHRFAVTITPKTGEPFSLTMHGNWDYSNGQTFIAKRIGISEKQLQEATNGINKLYPYIKSGVEYIEENRIRTDADQPD